MHHGFARSAGLDYWQSAGYSEPRGRVLRPAETQVTVGIFYTLLVQEKRFCTVDWR